MLRQIDPIECPGGIEQVTGRAVWRVVVQGRERWAYLRAQGNGRILIDGYPHHPVDFCSSCPTTPEGQTVRSAGANRGLLRLWAIVFGRLRRQG